MDAALARKHSFQEKEETEVKGSTFNRTLAAFLLVFLIHLSTGACPLPSERMKRACCCRFSGTTAIPWIRWNIVCDKDSRVWWTIFYERSMSVMDGFFSL